MQQPGVGKVLGFIGTVCLVCSLVVSGAATLLKERQDINAALDKQKNVLEAAGLKAPDERLTAAEIETRFAKVQARLVDLSTGRYVAADQAGDPAKIDLEKAAKDPTTSVALDSAIAGLAQVRRRPKRVPVFVVDDGERKLLVLPIWGKGLWSTLWGFIALERTEEMKIAGLTYYKHGETPGLGGEVDNPRWKAQWAGKHAFSDDFGVALKVVKGTARTDRQIDGLSGATITSRGVQHMIGLWLGEDGYGPFLARVRAGTAEPEGK